MSGFGPEQKSAAIPEMSVLRAEADILGSIQIGRIH